MPRFARAALSSILVLAFTAGILWWNTQAPVDSLKAETLKAEGDLKWYRGNIHTHSLWSDGDDYLEMIGLWYRDHGYDFLCFTDHNVLANTERWIDVEKSKGGKVAYEKLKARFPEGWVEERMQEGRLQVKLKTFQQVSEKVAQPGKFLLIQGEEISDGFQGKPIHMNATNIQEAIPPMHGNSIYETMQNNVNAVQAQRERTGKPILIHLNHPNFGYAIRAEDLMRVRGENFFEVYNGHPTVYNNGNDVYPSTDRLWDIILAFRTSELGLPLMYGIGSDDGHNYHKIPSRAAEPGRAWVMVLSQDLSPESLIAAMEAGRFYASSGVTLESVTSSEKGLALEIQGEPGVEYTIEFIGTRKGFDPTGTPVLDDKGNEKHVTRTYTPKIGEVFATVQGTTAAYEFQGDELYVRAKITSSRKHPNPSEVGDPERAWVQPAKGPAAMQEK